MHWVTNAKKSTVSVIYCSQCFSAYSNSLSSKRKMSNIIARIHQRIGSTKCFYSGHHLIEEANKNEFVIKILSRFEKINAKQSGHYLFRTSFQECIDTLIMKNQKHMSNKTREIKFWFGHFHTDEDAVTVVLFAFASLIDDHKEKNDFASLDATAQEIAQDPFKIFDIVLDAGKKHLESQIAIAEATIREIPATIIEKERIIVDLETEIQNTRSKATTDHAADQKLLNEYEDKLDALQKEGNPEVDGLQEEIKKIYARLTCHAIISKLSVELKEHKQCLPEKHKMLQEVHARIPVDTVRLEIFVKAFQV